VNPAGVKRWRQPPGRLSRSHPRVDGCQKFDLKINSIIQAPVPRAEPVRLPATAKKSPTQAGNLLTGHLPSRASIVEFEWWRFWLLGRCRFRAAAPLGGIWQN